MNEDSPFKHKVWLESILSKDRLCAIYVEQSKFIVIQCLDSTDHGSTSALLRHGRSLRSIPSFRKVGLTCRVSRASRADPLEMYIVCMAREVYGRGRFPQAAELKQLRGVPASGNSPNLLNIEYPRRQPRFFIGDTGILCRR